jgi:hypothetical protein
MLVKNNSRRVRPVAELSSSMLPPFGSDIARSIAKVFVPPVASRQELATDEGGLEVGVASMRRVRMPFRVHALVRFLRNHRFGSD